MNLFSSLEKAAASVIKDDKKRQIFFEVIRFGIVGVICFAVDTIILWAILNFAFDGIKTDLSVAVSTTAGFLFGLAINYILSIFIVFNKKHQQDNAKSGKSAVIFIIGSVVGLLINLAIMHIGAVILDFDAIPVKVIATAVAMVWNYISRKVFIFK